MQPPRSIRSNHTTPNQTAAVTRYFRTLLSQNGKQLLYSYTRCQVPDMWEVIRRRYVWDGVSRAPSLDLRTYILYTLAHDGHARSQGRRQPAAAKPSSYNSIIYDTLVPGIQNISIFRHSISAFRDASAVTPCEKMAIRPVTGLP